MNKIDELLKIKELLDSGIISEKEFKELKNNLIQLDNNEKSTSEIIPNNITKCSNCNSIINDNETICENCNVIDSKITSRDSLSENIIPISNSKIKYIFFGIIILCLVIGLNGYYNNSNKNIEEPPPVEVSAPSTSTSIPNETIATEIASDTMPAAQKSENSEVDENGEQIDNFIKYNVNCIKDLKTNYYWYIAPDKDFNFEEASSFSKNISERNLNWRVPTYNEIKSLYNSEYSAGEGFFNNDKYYPAKIHNVFNSIGSGSWFWVSDENSNSSKAYAINLNQGVKVNFYKNSQFPVHLLLISN